MRSAMVIASAALFTVVASSPALGQAARTTPPEKAVQKKVVRNVSGAVRTATNEAVVVVARDKGREVEWTFAVEPTTNIRKGAKSIVGADLKPGDAVQVRFSERDGKSVADAILVRAPKQAPPVKK